MATILVRRDVSKRGGVRLDNDPKQIMGGVRLIVKG